MSATTKPSSYIPGLDGIRAIAILMVFWAHALPGISYYIPATLGVTIFFFLSGYLITTLLRRELASTGTIVLRDFYLRRALRIFIPLYVIYALAAAFAYFVQHTAPGNWKGFFSMLFYCYNYTNVLRINAWVPLGLNVIWSLCVEEHFYLLFPLIYLAMARRRVARATQTKLLIAFCLLELVWRFILIAVIREHNLWTYFATDARLDSILWGSVLALTHNPVAITVSEPKDRSILPSRHTTLAFFAALLVLACSLPPRSIIYKESLRYTVQALALYVVFSFVIPHIRHGAVRWLEWKPLRYLGWISYVVYLSHDFILNVLTSHWPGRLALTSTLGFLISLGFATVIRYTLELPLQRVRSRLRHGASPATVSQ